MFQRSRRRLIIPFILPALILYTILYFYPVVQTVIWSFTDWSGHTVQRSFAGLKNYRLLITDCRFHGALKNTLFYTLAGGVLLLIPALFMAWGLSLPIRFKSFFRFVVTAPMVISIAVVGIMWRLIYEPNWGLLNNLLRAVGLGKLALPWMGDTRTALPAIIIAAVWQGMGMWVMLISAGLERIPVDLQEAAKIDGANDLQVFRYITLPLLWEILRTLLVVWIILALQVFAIIFVMSPWGGVAGSTQVVATYLYYAAFSDFHWAYATAIATVLLLIIFSLSILTMRVMRREVVQF